MHRILATFLLFGSASAFATCVANGPVATGEWIYRNHREFYLTNTQGVSALLTKEFYALLARDWRCESSGDICAIDAVPWTNAQDGEALPPIRFELLKSSGNAAMVAMHYQFGWKDSGAPAPVPRTAVLRLRRAASNGCWLLDDLVGGNGWSMREQFVKFKRFYRP
jgi:hypothetical protein